MSKLEKIAPSILLANGETYVPEGWMWVLAFALKGVPWALEEADKPEFRAHIRTYMIKQQVTEIDSAIKELEQQLDELKKERNELCPGS